MGRRRCRVRFRLARFCNEIGNVSFAVHAQIPEKNSCSSQTLFWRKLFAAKQLIVESPSFLGVGQRPPELNVVLRVKVSREALIPVRLDT